MKKIFFQLLSAFIAICFSITAWSNPATGESRVQLHTSAGDIVIALNNNAAPLTTANFLQYVNEGFYNNTLFHRVIPDFMIQGGGFQPGMLEKPTRTPIRNESTNGLKNQRGTIAMARTINPDSATAQFFINVVDNNNLDGSATKPGYAVFGRVVQGMDIVDKIAHVATEGRGPHQDVPQEDVIILSASVLQP